MKSLISFLKKSLPLTLIITACAQRPVTPDEQLVSGDPEIVRELASEKLVVFATGNASYYANRFHGRPTASGQPYNMYRYTAAHRTLPFGTKVLVKSKSTGRSVGVVVNDRGPFSANKMIDLSFQAAKDLGMIDKGVDYVDLYIVKK